MICSDAKSEYTEMLQKIKREVAKNKTKQKTRTKKTKLPLFMLMLQEELKLPSMDGIIAQVY